MNWLKKEIKKLKEKGVLDNELIDVLKSDDSSKEYKIVKMEERFKVMEKENIALKEKTRAMDSANSMYERRMGEVETILRNILVHLHKIKDEHTSMETELDTLRKENELLKDRNGLDLGQLTPRPNWKGLKETYDIQMIDTGEWGESSSFLD